MEETDTSIDIAIRCVDVVEVEWMSKACYTGFITKIYKSRSIADPRNPVDRCHSECVGKEGRSTTGTAPFLHHTRFRTKGSAGSQRHFLGRTSLFGFYVLRDPRTRCSRRKCGPGTISRGQKISCQCRTHSLKSFVKMNCLHTITFSAGLQIGLHC